MKAIEKVIKYYNEKQDEWIVKEGICNNCHGDMRVYVYKEMGSADNIGFYEWLFNPKYKVFETFNKADFDFIADKFMYTNSNPKEIINYLAEKT